MARTRNIKPGFFKNDSLAEIEPLGRLLFAGLWTIADRDGRLEDRPKRIKAEILPYDNCDIDALLTVLFKKTFIIRYEISAQRYIQILNFNKHQNPHIKEPDSEIPPPEQHQISTVQEPDKYGASTVQEQNEPRLVPSTLNLVPSTLNLVPITDISFNNEAQTTQVAAKTNAKPKNEPVQKKEYAEFITMTENEYATLVMKYGEKETNGMIEILDNFKGSKGVKYKSDYRTILSWVAKRYAEEQRTTAGKPKEEPPKYQRTVYL